MKRLLKEPLLHFLLAGAILFAIYVLSMDRDDTLEEDLSKQIIVSASRIAVLTENFSKVWQRPPTTQELDGLIQGYIRQEIMYREALAMGLDRDDTIVRRRMQQKMEFLFEDLVSGAKPTAQELAEYLRNHPDAFRSPSRFTFKHVYLNEDKRGKTIKNDVNQILTKLKEQGAEADVTKLGDAFLIGYQFEKISTRELRSRFGKVFADGMSKVPVNVWHGPVRSGFGLHLVFISKRSEGEIPPLADVRDVVEREWSTARRLEANKAFYAKLRKHYAVTVEGRGESTSLESDGNSSPQASEKVGAAK